jgi:hypothetical protein
MRAASTNYNNNHHHHHHRPVILLRGLLLPFAQRSVCTQTFILGAPTRFFPWLAGSWHRSASHSSSNRIAKTQLSRVAQKGRKRRLTGGGLRRRKGTVVGPERDRRRVHDHPCKTNRRINYRRGRSPPRKLPTVVPRPSSFLCGVTVVYRSTIVRQTSVTDSACVY